MGRNVMAAVVVFTLAGLGLVAFSLADDSAVESSGPTIVQSDLTLEVERDPDVPALPFADNPDPSQCGIPVEWGDDGQAYLTGIWEGELIQPEVLVYDSHLRASVAGGAPHGTEVTILLYQENPVLDYYLVSIPGGQQGWVPEYFLSFEPVV